LKNVDNDVPKYRKKSKKKGDPRSKHKHEYVECVYGGHPMTLDEARGFVRGEKVEYTIGTYCPACGKIGSLHAKGWTVDESATVDNGRFHFLKTEWSKEALRQFDPKTRTLPFFMLNDEFGQKYIEGYGGTDDVDR